MLNRIKRHCVNHFPVASSAKLLFEEYDELQYSRKKCLNFEWTLQTQEDALRWNTILMNKCVIEKADRVCRCFIERRRKGPTSTFNSLLEQ